MLRWANLVANPDLPAARPVRRAVTTMVTAVARIELSLDGARSLKDKRQIVRSVIERTRSRYPVSIAEVADQDLWQRAVIGVAFVSGSGPHAREVMQKVVDYITGANPEAEVLDAEIELVAPL